jgi:VRR-NUC domain
MPISVKLTRDSLQSIGGNALALICQVVAQDYSHRSSGVPDLLLWNVREGKAKFVEVKGPGDVLMETQKVGYGFSRVSIVRFDSYHAIPVGLDRCPT